MIRWNNHLLFLERIDCCFIVQLISERWELLVCFNDDLPKSLGKYDEEDVARADLNELGDIIDDVLDKQRQGAPAWHWVHTNN